MKRTIPVSALGVVTILWYCLLLAIPLALVFATAFFEKGTYGGITFHFTFANFLRAFDPIYLQIFWESVKLAFLTTVLCGAFGFPMAYAIATQPPGWRAFWFLAIALPSLTSLVIRIYALRSFLSPTGFGAALSSIGLDQGAPLVLFGMVSTYLPFFVLPVAAAMEKFNFLLVDAARDLGESDSRILFRVVLPQVFQPVRSAMILVFIPAFGEFLIPDLLGGARIMLVGNLITEQFLRARDWPFGSSLTLLLFLLLGLLFLLMQTVSRSPTSQGKPL